MEEKLRILKMVEEGTISAEQAKELLEALGDGESARETAWEESVIRTDIPYEDRMFRIIVDSADGDKVRVQFPIKAVKAILKVTGKLPIQMSGDMEGVDMEAMTDAVIQCLDTESIGDIVTVESADGDNVRVFIG
ncbi:MAG: hypothetical protein J6C43_00440 [Oscillospiraceae bacterium]|nr:hypothetical protein [Oscillospiraceae bacterium]MBP3520478.1 hypothetical protein [Oscillospiraceae bacterium]